MDRRNAATSSFVETADAQFTRQRDLSGFALQFTAKESADCGMGPISCERGSCTASTLHSGRISFGQQTDKDIEGDIESTMRYSNIPQDIMRRELREEKEYGGRGASR